MRLIADSDWSNKIEAMTKIRRLAHHHTDVLMASVHSVTLALISEVQNLRSQVARYAIITLADMFSTLKRSMDPELETCAKCYGQ
ncbi:FAM179B [Bugula neritina]|uniref:FAM179B n=1 Tax=Bugula neritina TaxID=10212 RepID=A0A7J7JMC1_BUGNE|nr:FAM179B [Bugula neritina]